MKNDRTGAERRTTVAEAAEVLGISAEAVRGRIRRGTIPVEREGGAVYVLLEKPPRDRTTGDQIRTTDDRPTGRSRSDSDALMSEMRGRIDDLREQLEAERQAHAEARRIIAGLVERIPAIEAPADNNAPDARGTPERGEEPQGRGDAPTEPQGAMSRPWWQRMFGR